MENRKIVRRTYTKDEGKECNKVMYAVAPRDASGGECFHIDIEKACLFKNDTWLKSSFEECTINGNNRYGDFSYKQEIIDVELTLKEK